MKFNSKVILMLLVLLLPGILVACGDDDDDNGGASGDVELSESFEISEEGATLKVNYPDDWIARSQQGGIMLATSDDVAEKLTGEAIPEIGDGEAGLMVLPFPAILLTLEGDAEEVSAVAGIESLAGDLASDGEFTVGEAEETSFGGKTAARATISGDIANGEIFLVESTDELFLFALYITDEYDGDAKAIAEAVVNSADLSN